MNALETYRGEEYRRLFAAAHRSLERTGGELDCSVGVVNPTDPERKAIIGLTGVHRPAGAKRIEVRLDVLDRRLRTATGFGLADTLQALTGRPVVNRPADRAQAARARSGAVEIVRGSRLYTEHAWFAAWAAQLERDGTITKIVNQKTPHQLAHAVRVLEYLDARAEDAPPIPLPVLADTITRDTKALNKGTLANLVLRALTLRAETAMPARAEEIRELWDQFGVVMDDLASRVLILNLPAQGAGLGDWLTSAAKYATPFQVTLHQLTTLPVEVQAKEIFVCENPAILRRAAQELGPACPPLICTEGQPSTAFHRLASRARSGGAVFRCHGDFDWPGIDMATRIITRYNAEPWRMGSADYRAALSAEIDHVALRGTSQSTPWDPGLAAAMSERGVAVYEESMGDVLLSDLRAG